MIRASHTRDLPGLTREQMERFLIFDRGFNALDVHAASNWVAREFAGGDEDEAMRRLVLEWMGSLSGDLGGDYHALELGAVVLLCERPPDAAEWLARYADRTVKAIEAELGAATWRGMHPLVVFSEADDYYQYVSRFVQDGEQAQSGGMFISAGYPHIALLGDDANDLMSGIVHELTHHCLDHYELPMWVNEGVAMALQRQLAPPNYAVGGDQEAALNTMISSDEPLVWDELAEQHYAFWNKETIQTFWAGTSFYSPGESNELSYNLAEVLLKLLCEGRDKEAFRSFLQLVDPEDGGQKAAAVVFRRDLGEVAGTFLGAGKWQPDPEAIAACWRASGWGEE